MLGFKLMEQQPALKLSMFIVCLMTLLIKVLCKFNMTAVIRSIVASSAQHLKEKDVVAMIRDRQNGRSLRAYAAELGITAGYLSDLYKGSRSPGNKILKRFGLTKKRQVLVSYTYSSALAHK